MISYGFHWSHDHLHRLGRGTGSPSSSTDDTYEDGKDDDDRNPSQVGVRVVVVEDHWEVERKGVDMSWGYEMGSGVEQRGGVQRKEESAKAKKRKSEKRVKRKRHEHTNTNTASYSTPPTSFGAKASQKESKKERAAGAN